ncbi:hypothetical protein GCM10010303_04380 [Streptomyces purpurascens]|nr:hypothetical protein GCM10010303_04380 [Streptomyces purpurascens]
MVSLIEELDALPDVYRDIVEVVADASTPMQAKQIVPRIGLPAVTAKIEGTRWKAAKGQNDKGSSFYLCRCQPEQSAERRARWNPTTPSMPSMSSLPQSAPSAACKATWLTPRPHGWRITRWRN